MFRQQIERGLKPSLVEIGVRATGPEVESQVLGQAGPPSTDEKAKDHQFRKSTIEMIHAGMTRRTR